MYTADIILDVDFNKLENDKKQLQLLLKAELPDDTQIQVVEQICARTIIDNLVAAGILNFSYSIAKITNVDTKYSIAEVPKKEPVNL